MQQEGPTPGARNDYQDGNALRVLRTQMRSAVSVQDKVACLRRASDEAADLVHGLEAELAGVSEQELMLDDALRLIKVWHLHAMGQAAERDYYLSAFGKAEDRADIRSALGIEALSPVEQIVMLITVDCMRADRLSCNGHTRPTSPAIDALAADGVNFPRAYSTAGQTAQSMPGILLSNFFQNFGSTRTVPDHLVTLAEVMSRNGYRTTGVNAANPHVSHFYAYDRGFDEYCDYLWQENFRFESETFVDHSPRRREPATEQELLAIFEDCNAKPDVYEALKQLTGLTGVELVRHIAARRRFYPYDAADIVKRTIADLTRNEGQARQFYWMHLMDLHENITVPYSRLGGFSMVQQFFLNTLLASGMGVQALAAQADKYRDLYDSAVNYVDTNVEVLRNFLADNGLLDSSLICLTADHGQELLENGRFGHGYDRLAEGVVHVPLVFSGGLARGLDGSAAHRAVSTLDIAPTILDVCGIDDVPETFLGRSLNDTAERPVYGQTFHREADNRCADANERSFELKPFPGPVRDCCPAMVFCIEGAYQCIHDGARDRAELYVLTGARDADTSTALPDPERLKAEMIAYFDSVYEPPTEEYAYQLSSRDAATVAHRLEDLGYL